MKLHAYSNAIFAQVYGQGTYGTCDYNKTNCSTSSGGSGSGSGSGGLVDTGMAVAAIVTIACVIVFVSLLVRFWRRSAKKPKDNLGDGPDNSSK